MNKEYEIIILIGMGIAVLFAISAIVSYILSQSIPEIFTGVMYFSLFGVLFGGGLVAIGSILSVGKPIKNSGWCPYCRMWVELDEHDCQFIDKEKLMENKV